MVNNCEILINKPVTGVYQPGQKVTGAVKYAIETPTEFKAIVLSLFGKGKCYWSDTKKRNSLSNQYKGSEYYFDNRISLLDNGNPTTLVDAGRYEKYFEFLLPDKIPSTYTDGYCKIAYYLKLKFYKTGIFSSDKRYMTEIHVKGGLDIGNENENGFTFGVETKLTKLFSSKNNVIKLKGKVDRMIFTPGDIIDLNYEVTNDTNVTIYKIKTELVAHKKYTACCGEEKYLTEVIEECVVDSPSVPDNSIANLANSITLLNCLYSSLATKVFNLEYKIRVTVKLPFPHFNLSVEVPIVIDYKFRIESMRVPYIAPPSYWEAMFEENDNID